LSVVATPCAQYADICSEDLTRYYIKSSRLSRLKVRANKDFFPANYCKQVG
jgi:hypothetical protein